MRLDMDCIRDVLLCVEENTGLRNFCYFVDLGLSESAEFIGTEMNIQDYQFDLLKIYENDTIIYHVNFCVEANLISLIDGSDMYHIMVEDLTPSGHDFLANIREKKNWGLVKSIAQKVGGYSLSAIIKIASGVSSNLIDEYLKSLNT